MVKIITAITIIAIPTLIQISPLQINPWSFLRKQIQHLIGYDEIIRELKSHRMDIEELKRENAISEYEHIRARILDFARTVNEETDIEEFKSIEDVDRRAQEICEKYKIKNHTYTKAISKIDSFYINTKEESYDKQR